jgi:hypothetical protein
VNGNAQDPRKPLQIIEGLGAFASLDQVEEVERHVELLCQLLLCPPAP